MGALIQAIDARQQAMAIKNRNADADIQVIGDLINTAVQSGQLSIILDEVPSDDVVKILETAGYLVIQTFDVSRDGGKLVMVSWDILPSADQAQVSLTK